MQQNQGNENNVYFSISYLFYFCWIRSNSFDMHCWFLDDQRLNLQAAASAAELQKEKNRCWRPPKLDVRWRSFEVWMPRAAWSWIFIDLHWFLLIFIDFHGFWRHPKPEGLTPCGSLWRPVAACAGRMDSPIYVYRFQILLSSGPLGPC